MDINRKLEKQSRHIATMQKQIDKLKAENDSLRKQNAMLCEKEKGYLERIQLAEDMCADFKRDIADLKAMKEQYRQAISEARKVKKNYEDKIKPLIKRLRREA